MAHSSRSSSTPNIQNKVMVANAQETLSQAWSKSSPSGLDWLVFRACLPACVPTQEKNQ
jgi:hypothetical protein